MSGLPVPVYKPCRRFDPRAALCPFQRGLHARKGIKRKVVPPVGWHCQPRGSAAVRRFRLAHPLAPVTLPV
jgi:hypothetical protein